MLFARWVAVHDELLETNIPVTQPRLDELKVFKIDLRGFLNVYNIIFGRHDPGRVVQTTNGHSGPILKTVLCGLLLRSSIVDNFPGGQCFLDDVTSPGHQCRRTQGAQRLSQNECPSIRCEKAYSEDLFQAST